MEGMARRLKRVSVWALVLVFVCGLFGTASAGGKGAGEGRAQNSLTFDDLDEAGWARAYVAEMKLKNIIKGFEDGKFRPNQPVTRVQAVTMAVRLMGLEEQAQVRTEAEIQLRFRDADIIHRQDAWAEGYLALALEKGLLEEPEGKFNPRQPASRLWVAVLLVKALQPGELPVNPDLKFTDLSAIPEQYRAYIALAVEKGLVKGYPDGTFQPNKPVTRAEMAALTDRADDALANDLDRDEVEGTVVSTGEGSITVDTADGENTYTLAEGALIFINKEEATLADLVAGVEVEIHLNADGQAILIKAEVEDKEEEFEGTVTALVPGSDDTGAKIAVRLEQGGEETYRVAAEVRVRYRGDEVTLADVRVGDLVVLKLVNGLVVQIAIESKNEEFEAQVVSVTAATGDAPAAVTLALEGGTQTTYTVAADAVIRSKGKTITLAEVGVGDIVDVVVERGLIVRLTVK